MDGQNGFPGSLAIPGVLWSLWRPLTISMFAQLQMGNEEDWGKKTRQGTLRLRASCGEHSMMVKALDDSGLLWPTASKKKKQRLISFAYSNNMDRSSGVILVVLRSSLALILSQCGQGHNFRQKFFSALRLLNWLRMVSRRALAWGSALLVSLKSLSCRWTARKRTGHYQGSISRKIGKCFLNGGAL